VFGTFMLVFVDCGGAIMGATWPADVTPFGRALATGLVVMAIIYAYGDVSGAHLNPAVTLAFALRRVFPWRRVPTYWLAQLAGALLAAAVLRATFGGGVELGATHPKAPLLQAFLFEAILTCLLVSIVLGTATRHRSIGPNAAIASGGVVALVSLFARPVSGASMNPARSLAPALLAGDLRDLPIYLVAPFVGAAVGVVVMRALHSRRHAEEREASEGEPK